MMTYAIGIEFVGTHYRGWQRQVSANSIQQTLETAFSKVANTAIELIAAGRTDAGVHAANMIAHFTTNVKRPVYNWIRGVNSLLPKDVAVIWIVPVPDDFHARFKAIGRRYRYITFNHLYRPAILHGKVTHHYKPLAVEPMRIAAQSLLGTHDFSSFRASECQSNQPIRHVKRAQFIKHGAFLVLDIEADGFLHHMVRNIMGALFAIGEGKLPPTAITELIAHKDRTLAPPTASPDGLYFVSASYPDTYQQHLPTLPVGPLWLGLSVD